MIALALLLATVTGNPPPAVYACTGAATVFTIPWPYIAASHVVATQTVSGVTSTVFGTVKPSIAPTSGTLTLSSACPNGATLTITRLVPLTQPQGFRTGNYSGAAHEQTFDRLEMQIQQNAATHATDKAAQTTRDVAQDTAIAAAINPTPATVNSNSLIIASNSTTSRTLAARAAETRNARDFGALGDGSTDDSAAIQAAINATPANGTLSIPPGTYVAKNIAVTSTIDIRGAGRSMTTIKLPALASLDGSPILNVMASGVTVRGVTFDGQKSLQPADGFSDSFNGGLNGQGRAFRASIRDFKTATVNTGLKVADCKFVNAYGAAIATLDVNEVEITDNRFEDNNFESVFSATTLAHGSGTWRDRFIFSRNTTLRAGSADATVNANEGIVSRYRNFEWSNNISDTTERGTKFEGCRDGTIIGNTVRTVTVSNFSAIKLQFEGQNITVANNTISNTGRGIDILWATPGLTFSNISIKNNSIDTTTGTSGDGIQIVIGASGATGISVTGNTMIGIARIGINMAGGGPWNNLMISGNNIRTTTGTNTSGVTVTTDTAGTSGLIVAHNLIDLQSAASNSVALLFSRLNTQTIAKATIIGNQVINQVGRLAIDDGNVALLTSGVFGANYTDGSIRFGSTGLTVTSPNVSGAVLTAGFQTLGQQMPAVTFTNLGTPANGSMLFCSDCTAASTPCTGAGTGALAVRANGAWKCF